MHILLVEDNPGDALLVREALSDADDVTVRTAGSLLEALDALAEESYDVVLLDLDLPDSTGLSSFEALRTLVPDVPVVIFTGQDSDLTAVAAVEAGAEDYVIKGQWNGDSLLRALRYALARHRRRPGSQAPAQQGRVIGVIGAKGGTGATTFACHLAAELYAHVQRPVLLLDADLELGCAAFLLKARVHASLLDAADQLYRLAPEFWQSLVARTTEGFDLLASPSSCGVGFERSTNRIVHVVRFASRFYNWVIVDLGRPDARAASLVPVCQQLYLVTRSGYLELHRTAEVLERWRAHNTAACPIEVVYCHGSRAEPGPRVLTKLIQAPLAAELPFCAKELNAAVAAGTLLGPTSAYRKAIRGLVDRLVHATASSAAQLSGSLKPCVEVTG